MADPFQSFLDQYKENCRSYTRSAPVKLLGLLIAFPVALGLAAAGALLARITGEPLAAAVVIFVGAITYLVAWVIVARTINGSTPQSYPQQIYSQQPYPPPAGQSPFAAAPSSPFPPAPNYPAPPNYPPPPSYTDPKFAAAEQAPWNQAPARSGSGGCVLAAIGVFAVLMLSCCGGGIFLSRFAMHAGPANQPFQAGAPFPGAAPFPNDPFADMQRQQQRQIDEMIQRQNEQWRQIEQDRQRIGQGPPW